MAKCGAKEPRCAPCSLFDEEELHTLPRLLTTADDAVHISGVERLDELRGQADPGSVHLRWTETAANCPPEVSNSIENDAEVITQAPDQPKLPYTIAQRALVGCRTIDAKDCPICKRTYGDGVMRTERMPGNNVRLDQQAVSRITDCAQCMLTDERLLRASSAQLAGCDCSLLIRPSGLVDACFSRDSCSCICRNWIRSSFRCPPAVVAASQQ